MRGVKAGAWSWFEESGPNHYAKHVHDLSAWLHGVRSDPDVGAMLQDDAEGWVAFGALIGSALIEVIRNSLGLLGISAFWQGTFIGTFIIIAVAFDRIRNFRSPA